MRAIVIGGTGGCGLPLVEAPAVSDAVERVRALGRRDGGRSDADDVGPARSTAVVAVRSGPVAVGARSRRVREREPREILREILDVVEQNRETAGHFARPTGAFAPRRCGGCNQAKKTKTKPRR